MRALKRRAASFWVTTVRRGANVALNRRAGSCVRSNGAPVLHGDFIESVARAGD
jgi:hypothetical protein